MMEKNLFKYNKIKTQLFRKIVINKNKLLMRVIIIYILHRIYLMCLTDLIQTIQLLIVEDHKIMEIIFQILIIKISMVIMQTYIKYLPHLIIITIQIKLILICPSLVIIKTKIWFKIWVKT
jgi:hypothetical protein